MLVVHVSVSKNLVLMLYTQAYVQYEVVLCDFCGWWMVTGVPEIFETTEEFAFL